MAHKEIDIEYRTCPIRQVVSRFGDKWSLLVLYHLHHRANDGVMRFGELHRQMNDCSQKMLSQTLKKLEQNHLVDRTLYPEVPPRVEYALTPLGRSLMPSIDALVQWGQEHFEQVVTP